MNDRMNNRRRKASQGKGQPIPERTTAGNFRLNLKEEDFNTSSVNLPQRRSDMTTSDHYASKQVYYNEKERKKQDREHRKRNRIKAGKNKRVFSFVWLAMVLLISFTLSSFLITGSNDFLAVGRKLNSDEIVEVTMPENVTKPQLARILSEKGVINSEFFFDLYCDVTSAEKKLKFIQPGSYKLETELDYEDILNTLMSGNTDRAIVEITFPEGINALEIAALFEENGIATKEETLEAMNESLYGQSSLLQEIKDDDTRYYKLEGYMFPDTYKFYKDDGPASAIKKMLSNCEGKLDIVQDIIQQSGMSTDEVLVLASIIQREAANTGDMKKVSAVLHNRLAEGSEGINKLECDSTIFYPYHTRTDLPAGKEDYLSVYNTYEIIGLPSGAICNPGIDAIKAALQPEADYLEYYYFCHSATGEAFYAKTVEEHEENKIVAGLTEVSSSAETDNIQ